MPEIESVYSKVVLDTKAFEEGVHKAIESLHHLGEEAVSLTSKLAGAGGLLSALTGVGAIAGLGAFVERSFEATTQQVKFAKQIGMSVEGLSALSYAANLANVSTEEFEHGMMHFQRTLGRAENAVTGHTASLERWGLNARELASMPLEEAFTAISAKIEGTASSSERAAIAFTLFGKQGQKFQDMLGRGPAGIQAAMEEANRLGVTTTEDMAKKIEDAERASKKLQAALNSIGRDLAVNVAPVVEHFASGLSGIIRGLKAIPTGGESGSPFRALTTNIAAGITGKSAAEVDAALDRVNKRKGNEDSEIARMRQQIDMLHESERLLNDVRDEFVKHRDQEGFSPARKKLEDFAGEMDKSGLKDTGDVLRNAGATIDDAFGRKTLEKDIKKATEAIKDQVLQVRVGADEYERIKLAQKGATDAMLAQYDAQKKVLEVVQEEARVRDEMHDKAQGIMEETQDPVAKFKADLADLGDVKDLLPESSFNLKALSLVKQLGGGSAPQMSRAVIRGSAEDVHLKNLDQMENRQEDVQLRIERLMREAENTRRALLEAARRTAEALQNLELVN